MVERVTVRKRFIAGALCPRCDEQDKLLMFSLNGSSHRECVACGFSETTQFPDRAAMPAGRLSEPSEPVKFIDPDPGEGLGE